MSRLRQRITKLEQKAGSSEKEIAVLSILGLSEEEALLAREEKAKKLPPGATLILIDI
jgi:hypothetical protein